MTLQYFKGAYKTTGEGLFIRECSDRTKDNGFKLMEGRFWSDIKKIFFNLRVWGEWNRFPKKVMDVVCAGTQGQVRWGFKESCLANVLDHGRELEQGVF